MLQIFLPDPGHHKGSCSCSYTGCDRNTREGKPFCSEHIESAPYIQSILAELDRRAEEEAILERRRGNVPKDGFFVREALLLLRTKNFTIKAFSRRLDISHRAANRLIDMLVKWGHAVKARTGRGGLTVSRIGGPDLQEEGEDS